LGSVDLSATLVDEFGNAISGVLVDFLVDGVSVGSGTTDGSGLASVTYNPITNNPAGSPYTITAEFAGNDNYNPKSGTNNLTVEKADTVITVDSASGVYLGSVDLSATLVDEFGNAISGVLVDFLVDGVLVGSGTTDGSGLASVTYSPITNNPAGSPYTITAEFAGNDNYNPKFGTNDLTVDKADTVITVDSASGVYLGSVDLSATLVDEFGNAISGVLVDFLVDGVLVGSGTTDGSGLASVTYSPITNNPAGSPYTITAEFAGNDYYNPTGSPHTINAKFAGNDYYNPKFGTNDLTVAKATTEIMVDNVIGNKGKTVNFIATLKDQYGNLLAGRTVNFLVNGVNAGSAVTDINGVANKSYFINLNGGTYNIQVDFIGDDYYIASTATGTLKVPQADLYVKSWASKNNPSVGENITITFKVGNRGPDTAENVVFVLKIPKGMEFLKASVDQGTFTYDKATRTITWNIGNVPVGDPYLYLVLRVLESGRYVLQPILSTDTYDPNLNSNIEAVIINAQSGSDNGHGVPMQNTGMPIWGLLMAIMVVCGGILIPFKK
jgi:uncharacterized repeat protein (TIGR01451 family)